MIRVHSKSGRFIALLPKSLDGYFAVVVTANGVNSFRASWPCSRLTPERPIRFGFDSSGNLVDVENTSVDGPDVLALSEDAQVFGERCIQKRRKE